MATTTAGAREPQVARGRRLSFDVPGEEHNALVREAADLSVTEDRSVSVSEVARRRVLAGSRREGRVGHPFGQDK